MDAKEGASSQTLAVAGEVLKHVDLERLGNYATAAAAAVVLFRRHPWLLVAAGTTAAVVGAWQLSRKNRNKDELPTVRSVLQSENGAKSEEKE